MIRKLANKDQEFGAKRKAPNDDDDNNNNNNNNLTMRKLIGSRG